MSSKSYILIPTNVLLDLFKQHFFDSKNPGSNVAFLKRFRQGHDGGVKKRKEKRAASHLANNSNGVKHTILVSWFFFKMDGSQLLKKHVEI